MNLKHKYFSYITLSENKRNPPVNLILSKVIKHDYAIEYIMSTTFYLMLATLMESFHSCYLSNVKEQIKLASVVSAK